MLAVTHRFICSFYIFVCALFKSKFLLMFTDTILKKYSSTVATIFTGIGSALLFGHKLTMNFILGISIVFISMHQVISREKERERFAVLRCKFGYT